VAQVKDSFTVDLTKNTVVTGGGGAGGRATLPKPKPKPLKKKG
jgi:hypothetical protein